MAAYSIRGKVVLVTGASSGIGKAIAEECKARGAEVAVCARNTKKLNAAFGDDVLKVTADVSVEEDCEKFVAAAIKKWGRVDVMINNAGISMRALFENAEVSVLRELMEINFWGAVNCTKAALPSIRENKGVVVGISSIAGYRGLPGRTGYSASKWAMQGFLEALRTELLNTGATAMWISPGFTASNIRNVALNAAGASQGETPLDEDSLMSAEECARRICNAIEARRRTLVMTGQGKLTVWLNKLFPSLADKLVYNHFLKEPASPLKNYGANE